jgi:outer membrane protein assembly factor BamE
MRIITLLIQGLLVFSLTSCTYDLSRRVVQQGNLLPESKISRLNVGMSKSDVAMLMGNSLISPVFNDNRWDYAYTWRKGSNSLLVKHVILYFSKDRLVKIERS